MTLGLGLRLCGWSAAMAKVWDNMQPSGKSAEMQRKTHGQALRLYRSLGGIEDVITMMR